MDNIISDVMWLTESGVGDASGKGFVAFGPDGGDRYQVKPESARRLAVSLLEAAACAERAMRDLVTLLSGWNTPKELIAGLLSDLRASMTKRLDDQGK